MAFRFRKSVRLAPGIRVNFSSSGVSTTLGGRGVSVTTGRRGTRVTAGLPGSGLSFSSGLGGSGGGRSAGGAADNEAAGCMGCGAAGFFLLLFMGFCASLGDPPSRSAQLTDTLGIVPLSTYAPPEPRETFYIHGRLNVRSGAGTSFEKVRTLSRGERVTLGAKDASGWAPIFDALGQRVGYVYRASDNIRSYAPRAAAAMRPRAPRHPSGASAICRDGTYSYSAHRRGTCSWHGGVSRWL
jgi:hypothetical protein